MLLIVKESENVDHIYTAKSRKLKANRGPRSALFHVPDTMIIGLCKIRLVPALTKSCSNSLLTHKRLLIKLQWIKVWSNFITSVKWDSIKMDWKGTSQQNYISCRPTLGREWCFQDIACSSLYIAWRSDTVIWISSILRWFIISEVSFIIVTWWIEKTCDRGEEGEGEGRKTSIVQQKLKSGDVNVAPYWKDESKPYAQIREYVRLDV